jgi:hypothetical protein
MKMPPHPRGHCYVWQNAQNRETLFDTVYKMQKIREDLQKICLGKRKVN